MQELKDSNNRQEVFFNDKGEITNETDGKHVCAKVIGVGKKTTERQRFYVKEYGGDLFDPLISKTDFGYHNKRWRLRSISEVGFNHYMNFLKNRHGGGLRRAERELRTNG